MGALGCLSHKAPDDENSACSVWMRRMQLRVSVWNITYAATMHPIVMRHPCFWRQTGCLRFCRQVCRKHVLQTTRFRPLLPAWAVCLPLFGSCSLQHGTQAGWAVGARWYRQQANPWAQGLASSWTLACALTSLTPFLQIQSLTMTNAQNAGLGSRHLLWGRATGMSATWDVGMLPGPVARLPTSGKQQQRLRGHALCCRAAT